MSEGALWDVCVVGSGAGGGLLAHQLVMAGLKVITLEQGPMLADGVFREANPPGMKPDFGVHPHTRWPADPHEAFFGNPLFAPADQSSASREDEAGFTLRQLFAVGGLQNLWNGVSLRFSAEDLSLWPVSYGSLAPHYEAVERLITVCGHADGLKELPDGAFISPKPFRPVDELLIEALERCGAGAGRAIANRKAIETRPGSPHSCISTGGCAFGCPASAVYKFSTRLLPQISGSPNYLLRPNAKVVRLIAGDDGGRIRQVEYLDTASRQVRRVDVRAVVLAAGAVETPRILFNSASERHPQGLGNRNDQVGRRLQDNPKTVLSTSLRRLWGRARDYDIGYGDPLILMGRGVLPDGETFPFLGHDSHSTPFIPHYLSGLRGFPSPIKRRLARMMFNSYVTIGLFAPGDPDPDNRVRPARSVDAFGIPQVAVSFRASPRTQAMMKEMERWGRRLLRRASGTIIKGASSNDGSGVHYAGTTAMSAAPDQGVVDDALRAHHLSNLYVCDGGVIPVLPEKHLTLTIMALAHRLGAHLSTLAAAGALETGGGAS